MSPHPLKKIWQERPLIDCLDFFSKRSTPSTSLEQVEQEAGVTVMFHVLLMSSFKMEGECLHIRAKGDDLGNFNLNCVDLEFLG